jgi:ATP dependent DNA ligase domain
MLASSATQLPKGAGWSYEVKWDGYRTLALKVESRVQLLSRNLKDATSLYPAITREVGRLRAESLLLDGEVVAVDEEGCLRFRPSIIRPLTRSCSWRSTCCIWIAAISRPLHWMNVATCLLVC